MIILKPITTAQTLKFIGRYDICNSIVLRDEQDNTEVTLTPTFIMDRYYLKSDIIFNLIEGRFYTLTAYNGANICYKDKIFCTSQTNYSINNNEYTQHSTNNDYITYG